MRQGSAAAVTSELTHTNFIQCRPGAHGPAHGCLICTSPGLPQCVHLLGVPIEAPSGQSLGSKSSLPQHAHVGRLCVWAARSGCRSGQSPPTARATPPMAPSGTWESMQPSLGSRCRPLPPPHFEHVHAQAPIVCWARPCAGTGLQAFAGLRPCVGVRACLCVCASLSLCCGDCARWGAASCWLMNGCGATHHAGMAACSCGLSRNALSSSAQPPSHRMQYPATLQAVERRAQQSAQHHH